MITFVPTDHSQIQAILDLADDPQHDVHSTFDEQFALVITEELFERYQFYTTLRPSPKEPEKETS